MLRAKLASPRRKSAGSAVTRLLLPPLLVVGPLETNATSAMVDQDEARISTKVMTTRAALDRLEMLDLLLEAIASGFLDWHIDEGRVHYSPRFKLILGYEDIEPPHDPSSWLEMTHPQDRPGVTMALDDLLRGEWPFDLTFRMRHLSSGYRWMRVRAAVGRDASGVPKRVIFAFGDVSAQVRAERQQASLISAMPDLLISVQNDSTIDYIKAPEGDERYATGLPQPGERLLASNYARSWSAQAARALKVALKERRSTHFEAKHQVKSSSLAPGVIEVRVFPSTEDESLFIIRDITAEKFQREQGLQSQKLEAIGQLAAGIAHEINTPLQFVGDNLHFLTEAAAALLAAVEQYRTCFGADSQRELDAIDTKLDLAYMREHLNTALADALEGVNRVSVIVQAMKSFAHPGVKERRAEDLNQALDTTLTLSTNVWKYVADVERDFSPDLPKVECVIGEINQVFLNLITNAAHAISEVVGTGGNRGRIRVTTRLGDQFIEVRISDTGAGIPDGIRSRIFEPFFTTKSVGKGTGQGLPLARAVIMRHDGELDCESVVGQGTTFIVRLPMTAPKSSEL
jgi:signal transduction histidine kinase